MAMDLFRHNREAYDAVCASLRETGRACVIHPTGTGKSFIGFKYCEDRPEKRVLWLSPSEYIFKTQCENLSAAGSPVPENISFMTYAKLSLLTPEEMAGLRPDAVILDELHRAAAPTWEQPVQTLLSRDPAPQVIGLTATSIRYLDGQKDTSKTFNLPIASEMTLGEAIARGILSAPRYILSIFAYEKDYDRLKARVRRAKNRAVRDEAEKYLEALRRALEKADGLDVIFQKHMTDRTGKYLVFCANLEHMREMMAHVPEWFGRVDPRAHVYYAYSDDPNTSRAFRAFKADDSEHLKLLFTIDMLNEGIHVEDVSGVILFRPTISPIIYKQQIGRALSASKTKEPVIFDIVNNIENLYSISTLQEELRQAVAYYRFLGQGGVVINERFQVLDEAADARLLFDRLNETLTASWERMYELAKSYYEEHGDLEVPRNYRTADGYALGLWLQTQRKVRAGVCAGLLDEGRIALLDEIGMVWESYTELSWRRWYEALCRYRERHGDLDIPSAYVDEEGLALGSFICNLRSKRRDGRRNGFLTNAHMEELDRLGMIWERLDYGWEQNYQACAKYYVEHGNLNISDAYVEDGLRIGAWVRRQRMIRDGRAEGVLTPERIQRLDDIGMVWTDAYTARWEYGYEQAKRWHEEHGDLKVPGNYVSDTGFPLGAWLKRHQPNAAGKTQIKLTPEKIEKLSALGMVWERPEDSWEVRFALAERYYREHGNLNIPSRYKMDGVWMAKWVSEQRQIYKGNRPGKTLTEEQIRRLESIGMSWENRTETAVERAWTEQYSRAKEYYKEFGDLIIPNGFKSEDGRNLSSWISRQRRAEREGKLTREQRALLDAIGMDWQPADPWETGYSHAEQYFREHGNLRVNKDYISEDGYRLGAWISRQRYNYTKPDKYRFLSESQARRLERLGMVWSPQDEQWQKGWDHAKSYLRQLKGLPWKQTYVSPEDGFKTGEWIRGQLRTWEQGKLDAEKRQKLEAIGLSLETKVQKRKKVSEERRSYETRMGK